MGYPSGQVDIPGLAKVGSSVTHCAGAFEKAFSAESGVLAPGSTLTGWATGAAVAAATEAWSTFVRNLAGQIRSFGADLSSASSAYQSTDSTAADRVAGAGTSLASPFRAGRHGRAFE